MPSTIKKRWNSVKMWFRGNRSPAETTAIKKERAKAVLLWKGLARAAQYTGELKITKNAYEKIINGAQYPCDEESLEPINQHASICASLRISEVDTCEKYSIGISAPNALMPKSFDFTKDRQQYKLRKIFVNAIAILYVVHKGLCQEEDYVV